MATAAPDSGSMPGVRDVLDFLFDASGWRSLNESSWHGCASGTVYGHDVRAVAFCGSELPVPAAVSADVASFVEQEISLPLVVVLTPGEVLGEPDQHVVLNRLLAGMLRARGRCAVVAVVLGPLIGPLAVLAHLADIICFGPAGSLALADAETARKLSPNPAPDGVGPLRRNFATDAAALLGARDLLGRLVATSPMLQDAEWAGGSEDAAFERLAGLDGTVHVDERRLLRLIADDRTFVELGSAAGLLTGLALVGGTTVGILASGAEMSGVLDAAALVQAGQLVAFCGRRSFPVLSLIDCPGVVPDDVALGQLVTLLSTWTASDVTAISLVVRKAIGAAVAALIPSGMTRHALLYWPDAKAGLLREAADVPRGRMIAPRETRRVLLETLATLREQRA